VPTLAAPPAECCADAACTVPAKPGLVFDPSYEGSGIEVEVWALDVDGNPGQKVQSLQQNAAPSVKPKWKVAIPPAAAGRNEVEFQFLVKDAQGAQVKSDTLFVWRPRFRFSV